MALYTNYESRRSEKNREKLLLSIILRTVICFQSSAVVTHDSSIFYHNDIFSNQMTKSRLPMSNLRENNWSKVHRVVDRSIASAILRYKVMRFTENNEIFYLEGQFIYTEYLKDQCFRNSEFYSVIYLFLQRSVQIIKL